MIYTYLLNILFANVPSIDHMFWRGDVKSTIRHISNSPFVVPLMAIGDEVRQLRYIEGFGRWKDHVLTDPHGTFAVIVGIITTNREVVSQWHSPFRPLLHSFEVVFEGPVYSRKEACIHFFILESVSVLHSSSERLIRGIWCAASSFTLSWKEIRSSFF